MALVKIAAFQSGVEAGIAAEALRADGIPVSVETPPKSYPGIPQPLPVVLYVDETNAADAKAYLKTRQRKAGAINWARQKHPAMWATYIAIWGFVAVVASFVVFVKFGFWATVAFLGAITGVTAVLVAVNRKP